MNSKELIFSTIILVLILIGFGVLITRGAEKRALEEQEEESTMLTTEGSDILGDVNNNSEPIQQNNNQPPAQRQPVQNQKLNAFSQPPAMNLTEGADYKVQIATNMGNITIDLYEDLAPVTVNSFVFLASQGYYDGLIFHRVIQDFMIQGGDPTGTGRGGPGYSFEDEQTGKPLIKGSLAMANAGPGTNGSQFFIVTADATPWLDGKHTNFGEVIEGLDVVEAISKVQTGPGDKPTQDIVMQKVLVLEQR